MAQIQQLRPNLLELEYEEALSLFQEYYDKREKDLISITVTPKRVTRAKEKTAPKLKQKDTVSISPDQLAILKKLGLI